MNGITAAPVVGFRVPDDLTELDQWVLWRYESRNGKTTKVPYQVSGQRADSTKPETWAVFDDAVQSWSRQRRQYAGVGFVFSREDPFAGIDLDDSLDQRGDVKAWARGIVGRFSDTYIEVSPSRRGLKIWARGSLPTNVPGVQVADGFIELYDHSRYFAVTGQCFRTGPLAIEDHTEDLLTLYDRLMAGRKTGSVQPFVEGRIPKGQQHNTLVSLCGTLRARGICDEAVEACLQIVNEMQCAEPGPREHVSRIVCSSRKWGTG
jgi:primase-polymerase (primpol)-like protein